MSCSRQNLARTSTPGWVGWSGRSSTWEEAKLFCASFVAFHYGVKVLIGHTCCAHRQCQRWQRDVPTSWSRQTCRCQPWRWRTRPPASWGRARLRWLVESLLPADHLQLANWTTEVERKLDLFVCSKLLVLMVMMLLRFTWSIYPAWSWSPIWLPLDQTPAGKSRGCWSPPGSPSHQHLQRN